MYMNALKNIRKNRVDPPMQRFDYLIYLYLVYNSLYEFKITPLEFWGNVINLSIRF